MIKRLLLSLALVAITTLSRAGEDINLPFYINTALAPGYSTPALVLSNNLPHPYVTHVDNGVPQGTSTSGSSGTSFQVNVPRLGMSGINVGLSISWTLGIGPNGVIVVNYTIVNGMKTTNGQILTNKSVTGLPGYSSPGTGSTGNSTSNNSSSGFMFENHSGSQLPTDSWNLAYYSGWFDPVGTVTMGPTIYFSYGGGGD